MPNHFDRTGVLKSLPKFKMILNPNSYRMAHPVYKLEEIEGIKKYHHAPENFSDKLALTAVSTVRKGFDVFSRYNPEKMNERDWLFRCIVLETVAGVPGMVAGMHRHLRSLRTLEHDNGWIHHLLQEAENERMHLFIFMQLRNPGVFTRIVIGLGQAIFLTAFNISYALSPKFSHRFVGYLEEEAVHTYTMALKALDEGKLPYWEHMRAPSEAVEYYGLDPQTAKVRDVLLSIRADEAVHRSINHHFSDIPQFYEVANDKIQVT